MSTYTTSDDGLQVPASTMATAPAAPLRLALWAALAALLAGGIYLWAVRGNALLLDLATGVKGLLCL